MSESPVSHTSDIQNETGGAAPRISGTVIVVLLFLLGIGATGLLFVYFELHTGPFRPLREALGREFKHSRPSVEGGRPKGRGPWTLRISMGVKFDPNQEEESRLLLERVLTIARAHQDLKSYEKVEVNLIHFVPEKEAKPKTFSWTGDEAASLPDREPSPQ